MRCGNTRRPAGGLVPLLVASSALALALTACGGDAPRMDTAADATTAAASRPVATDFRDGIPAGWEARRATVEHAAGGQPSSWVRLDAAGTPAYVSVPPGRLDTSATGYRLTARFRVRARTAGGSVGLATVANGAGEHHADLFVDARTGRCRVDLFIDDSATSPGRCDDGAWHVVTMQGGFGTSTYALSWTLDGVAMPGVRSTHQPPTTVHRLWLGDATPGKFDVTDWTEVALELR